MRKRTPRRHRAVDPGAALRALGMKQQLDDSMLQVWDAQLAVVPRDAMRYAVREVHSRMDRGEVFEVMRG